MLEIRLSTNNTYQDKSPIFHITDSHWKDYIAYVNICGYWQRSLESDGGFDVAKPERDYYSTGEMLSDFQIDRLVTRLFSEKLKDLNKKLLKSNKCVDIAIFKYGASYSGGKEYFLATDDGGKNFTKLARISNGHWHLVNADDNLKQFVSVLHGNLEECYRDIVKREEEKMSDLEFEYVGFNGNESSPSRHVALVNYKKNRIAVYRSGFDEGIWYPVINPALYEDSTYHYCSSLDSDFVKRIEEAWLDFNVAHKDSDLEFTEEKHVNQNGAIQTKLPTRMDLIPADVLLKVSSVLAEGADKYGEWNWIGISVQDNLNHALTHIYRYLNDDNSEPHLVHAICRLMFASHVHNTIKDND